MNMPSLPNPTTPNTIWTKITNMQNIDKILWIHLHKMMTVSGVLCFSCRLHPRDGRSKVKSFPEQYLHFYRPQSNTSLHCKTMNTWPVCLFTLQLLLALTLPLQDGQAELTRVVDSWQMFFFYFTQFYCHQFPHPSTRSARHMLTSGPCLRVTNLLQGLGNASCSVDVPSSTTDKLLELMCNRWQL